MAELTVLTFGVFDLLHFGHINLFKRAKALGDRLTVAVQNNEYIEKYKPEANVVNSTEERIQAVKSVPFVDHVIIYNDVDKDIEKVNFDILVVGGDQNHEGFQKAILWCENNGKKVIRLQRTEGISSSQLRNIK